jgi:glycosyltransferase involved in cell wall biosynthesis
MSSDELKPGISLCMIVKDEESSITRVIESIQSLVSETIVVDTGSSDRTKEYAQRLGARVFDFEWDNDFSRARNYALAQARHEWILVLDADERIAQGDHHHLRALMDEPSSVAAVLWQRNYCESPDAEGWQANQGDYAEGNGFSGYFDVPVIRFFRNQPSIRFAGVVHEVVDASLAGKKKRYLDVPIHHYTYFEKPEVRARKSDFYLELLLKQFRKDPEDMTTWFLLGRQYYTLGKDAEAVVFLKRVVERGTRCEMAYDNLSSVYFRSGMYEEARDTLEALLRINPRYAEAFTTLGLVYYELGYTSKAFDTLKRAIMEQPQAFKPSFNLAAICYKEHNFAEALKHIKSAEKLTPGFARVYYLKFYILYEMKLWADAQRAAERLKMIDGELYANIESLHAEVSRHMLDEKGAVTR